MQDPRPEPAKLYVVTRSDLAPGAQAAQSAHAAFQFSSEHPDVAAHWLRDSAFLVLVSVSDEDQLLRFTEAASARLITHTLVREPDFGDAATAVALGPCDQSRRLCSSLPLTLREPAML